MIIDIHAHVCAAPELYAWKDQIFAASGALGARERKWDVDWVREHPMTTNNIAIMDKVGTDIQFISPRPYTQAHSEKPSKLAHYWNTGVNNYIAKVVEAHPTRFRGVVGLPQPVGRPIEESLPELERCITELRFVGTLLDTDPGEGDNSTPRLDDEYWYPLWAKLIELDVPALIHSAGCKHGRETYSEHFISEESMAILSLANSRVFHDFPGLKIIVAHGGGSVPYQIGRWRAERGLPGVRPAHGIEETFDESMRHLFFDSVLHEGKSLALLLDLVGPDRILFGTENPGAGSAINPVNGRSFDDIKPTIEEIPGITEDACRKIFEGNARRLFTRLRT